ncbi:Coatomer subunit zeta-1 [Tritrichomonas musculus]|uniref:Coatomer subunit zeta n=1 Tax=Tritrichomonas musculus TaxID=1915356 RepID=A0ABR2KVB6_9EUKA
MGIEDLTRIHSLLIVSTSGTRIIAQYYNNVIPEDQRSQFENEIYQRGAEDMLGEVMQHDKYIIVYRLIQDFLIFIIGDLKSNELLLDEVLETISTSISLVYKGKVNSESLIKQIDLLYLLLDETIEQGFIFEGDPEIVAARALLKNDNAFAGKGIRSMNGF